MFLHTHLCRRAAQADSSLDVSLSVSELLLQRRADPHSNALPESIPSLPGL